MYRAQASAILMWMFITTGILIDAKSILGVLSMDLNQILTVKCHGENGDFDRVLAKFAIA